MSKTMPAMSSGMFSLAQAYDQLKADGPEVPLWLGEMRHNAMERFFQEGFPTRRDEDWKYTSVRPIVDGHFRLADYEFTANTAALQQALSLYTAKDETCLVFVDGVFAPTFSTSTQDLPKGVTILPLAKAWEQKEAEVREILSATSAGGVKAFAALNQAFLLAGVYIEIERKAVVERPIHIIYTMSERAEPIAVFPRNLVVAKESAQAQIVETYLGLSGGQYLVNAATDILLGAASHISHARIQAEAKEAYHIAAQRVSLARDAKFKTMNWMAGGRLSRADIDIVLNGEGSEAKLDGLYLAKGEQHIDNHTSVDHRVPHALSSQLYKGILGDQARGVFNGKVFVRQDAQQTQAYQLNRNLLLSNEAEVDTKPELWIDADDVKCSHGAAVGQLNRDEIFYLQSRGIEQDEAKRLLAKAFADEVIYQFGHSGLQKRLLDLTNRYFAG